MRSPIPSRHVPGLGQLKLDPLSANSRRLHGLNKLESWKTGVKARPEHRHRQRFIHCTSSTPMPHILFLSLPLRSLSVVECQKFGIDVDIIWRVPQLRSSCSFSFNSQSQEQPSCNWRIFPILL